MAVRGRRALSPFRASGSLDSGRADETPESSSFFLSFFLFLFFHISFLLVIFRTAVVLASMVSSCSCRFSSFSANVKINKWRWIGGERWQLWREFGDMDRERFSLFFGDLFMRTSARCYSLCWDILFIYDQN